MQRWGSQSKPIRAAAYDCCEYLNAYFHFVGKEGYTEEDKQLAREWVALRVRLWRFVNELSPKGS